MTIGQRVDRELLLVSILIFSGTENIDRLISTLPEKLLPICENLNLQAKILIRKNNPELNTKLLEEAILCINSSFELVTADLVDDGVNSGFGQGHNLNYRLFPADYFFILNDDLDMPHLDWMMIALPRLKTDERLAMIGDVSNPNGINPFFGNGTFPDQHRSFTLRYAEASILLVKGSAFEAIGMFDETITWAMGEDSDMSFKAQQLGYYIDWMPMPHRHFRSTSFNSLPQYQKSSVLEHNRARVLAKWGNSFETGSPGKFELLDVFSDGLGDMLCALLHIKAEYDRLPVSMHENIVVNVGNETIARMLLPTNARITSERDLNVVRNMLGNSNIASVRSCRTTNYALPYNIHSLVSGALSLPFAGNDTLLSAAAALKNASPRSDLGTDYCVVHLEFEREQHHGRGPSKAVIDNILSNLHLVGRKIVIVGKNSLIPLQDLKKTGVDFVDLQGRTTLPELISIVANSSYMIGIDSFPLHVAQVARVPSVVFFGSVSPILRVLHQDLVWPLTADLDCLGCYHDQIEPGAPFCMKMNQECTREVSEERALEAIQGMIEGKPFDWSDIMTRLNRTTARFVEFQKFHPQSRKQLHDTVIPNQQISELIYELTDRISQTYSRHVSGPFVAQLQEDNARIRDQLLDAQTKLNSYEAVKVFNREDVSKMPSISAGHLISRMYRCDVEEQDGYLLSRSSQLDPQIEFKPLNVTGKRLGISITVRAHPPTTVKIYWRGLKGAYSETNSISIEANENGTARVWWYHGILDRPIQFRIDPSEGPGNSRMKIDFLGEFEPVVSDQSSALSIRALARKLFVSSSIRS